MSKKLMISCAAAMILAISLSTASMAAVPALPEGALFIYGGYADVTGDGAVDEVYLIARRAQADSDFMSEHGLLVIEGKEGKQLLNWLGPESAAYPGTLAFGKLDPGNSFDVLVNLPSGGSGGITTAMPVSMEGGTLRIMADLYALNDGPAVDMLVNDGYKMVAKYEGIDFTIDLLKGAAKDDAGTYSGIFDESGRKVGTLKPVMDPVGATEMADVNNDGISELVTYRSVWAVYHANTVAIARTVWGWEQDAIKPRFVSVKPLFSPQDYASYLSSIKSTDPAEALKLAIDKYTAAFSAAPPYWRYEAFLVYRDYASAVAQKISETLPSTGAADQATMQKVYQLADRLAPVGLGIFYVGEGELQAMPDPKFQLKNLEKYLQRDAVEFLLLEEVEVYDIWAMDAALNIQLEEVGNRLHDWEYFLQSFPGSAFEQYAMQQYVAKLAAFILGIDNTPNFSYSDGTLNPGVMASLEKYVREYGNMPSAKTVAEAIGIMKEGNGKLNQGLIDRIIALIPKPTTQEENTEK
ncbi:MAG TPA: hypothetical protein PLI10_04315 [Bacillota bacterium]|nr:hypothetical protein [Bacillota bacterium]HOH09712.1 hypothetical protein [Bacillota bacterium]HOS50625.1 hypothetical protein [Bacillota bacterium]HOY88321.1 hypothetical protein [Bacillota bacterium]HPI00599.1 hypothetical protein [Bacillota bacterium]